MTVTEQRQRIVAIARTWLNTPFVDNQGLKHCGVDCAHYPALVFEEAGLTDHINIPYYSPQIYLNKLGDDSYLQTILRYLREVTDEKKVQPGDLVLYKQAKSFTHCGIIESWPDKILHPIRPHGVIYSSANEGFLLHRAHRFFSIFAET